MRLPLIKHLSLFIEQHDVDFVIEAAETLEALTEAPGIKDEELDVIGELISNMHGALEVQSMIDAGTERKQALKEFMSRVLGSIDQ